MEPKNHPFGKEHHLPNLHFCVQHVNFPGCILASSSPGGATPTKMGRKARDSSESESESDRRAKDVGPDVGFGGRRTQEHLHGRTKWLNNRWFFSFSVPRRIGETVRPLRPFMAAFFFFFGQTKMGGGVILTTYWDDPPNMGSFPPPMR